MATYYVSNSTANGFSVGNDSNNSTQAQSRATPWLTLQAAFGSVSAGDIIIMNSGDYAENGGASGALQCTRNFTSSPVTVRSWTGVPSDVTIRGEGGQAYSVRIWQTSAGGYRFENVCFTTSGTAATVQTRVLYCGGAFSRFYLNNCIITADNAGTAGTADIYGILADSAANVISDWYIHNTIIDLTSRGKNAAYATPVQMRIYTNGGTASNVGFYNCITKGIGGIDLEGVVRASIVSCDIHSIHPMGKASSYYAPALLVGVDLTSGTPAGSAYPGCYVLHNRVYQYVPDNTLQHTVVSGKGADGAVWQGNTIISWGGGFDFVVKSDGAQLTGNTQLNLAGSVGTTATTRPYGLYLKGSQNVTVDGHISLTFGAGFAIHSGNNTSDSGAYLNKVPTGCVIRDSIFGALGTAAEVIAWEGTSVPSMSNCAYIGSLTDTQTGSNAVPSNSALGLSGAPPTSWQHTGVPGGIWLPPAYSWGTAYTDKWSDIVDIVGLRGNILEEVRSKRLLQAMSGTAVRTSYPLVGGGSVNFQFAMTENVGHTPTAGATVTAQYLIDGGSWTTLPGTITDLLNGLYSAPVGTAVTNGTAFALRFTATGCDTQIYTGHIQR